MFALIRQVFIVLLRFSRSLASIVNAVDYIKCIFLNNQQCMAQYTLNNLHSNEYIQGLRYYPFAVSLNRCMGNRNTLNYVSNRVCVSNKTEDLDLSVFNIITGTNESKALTKQLSCECKCKFNGRIYNSNGKWNNSKC